jgi:DNA-binding transcriptional regulator YhcF (GntR family)
MSTEKNTGFILLHRSIRGHWIWKDPIKLQWWLDILMECNHSDQKVSIGFELFECKRGQSLNSLLTWSKMWRVDVSNVRRYFRLLENDGMIVTENVQKTTRLTVCNYDSYNNLRQAKDRQTNSERQSTQFQTTVDAIQTNNELNNELKNDKECVRYAPREIEEFKKFEKWLDEHAPRVHKMKEPFTIKQFLEIKELAAAEIVRDVLKAMHNRGDLLTKYRSANLTFRSWIKRELNQPKNATHQQPVTNSKQHNNISFIERAFAKHSGVSTSGGAEDHGD